MTEEGLGEAFCCAPARALDAEGTLAYEPCVPPRRLRPPTDPVTISVDGDRIVADQGASIASALVAAGQLVLARSPKFHRPRGPSCLRAACDGCLMRVDGVPNVMTCRLPAHEGARVERQNVILSSKLDLLRAADWFFPHGMNHHELFAGVPGLQGVVQSFARRVSGLGTLPDEPPVAAARRAHEETAVARPGERVPVSATDVLVVGGGPAGLLAAIALRQRGASVTLLDDDARLGGCLRAFPPSARLEGEDVDRLLADLCERVEALGVVVRTRATLVGVLEGDDWLVDGVDGLERFSVKARVLATGAQDHTPLFVGNDLPGVLSARAAGRLLRDGVLVGDRPLLVGRGAHLDAFEIAARAAGARVERLPDGATVESVRGLSQVRSVRVRSASGARLQVDADAVVHDGPPAPSFQLAVEAGGEVEHRSSGYAVRVDARGQLLGGDGPVPAVFATGELTGAPLAIAGQRAAAAAIAAHYADRAEASR